MGYIRLGSEQHTSEKWAGPRYWGYRKILTTKSQNGQSAKILTRKKLQLYGISINETHFLIKLLNLASTYIPLTYLSHRGSVLLSGKEENV